MEMVESGEVKREEMTQAKAIHGLSVDELSKDVPGTGSERKRSFCDLLIEKRLDGTNLFHTEDGPVEVPDQYVQLFEKWSRKIEYACEELSARGELLPEGEKAGDLPREVEEKVLALAERKCAHCGRTTGLHIHHIIFKSKRGTNAISNLVCICNFCHEALHNGNLEVFRDSNGLLYWRNKADRLNVLLEEEVKEYLSIPAASIVEVPVERPEAGRAEEEAIVEELDPGSPPAEPTAAAPVAPVAMPVAPAEAAAPVEEEPRSVNTPPPSEKSAEETAAEAKTRESAEEAERAQRGSFGATEARERTEKALAYLASQGLDRPPTVEDILSIALRRSLMWSKVTNATRAANGGRRARGKGGSRGVGPVGSTG